MVDLNKYCKLELIDGIMHAQYAKDVYIDLEIAEEIVKQRIKIGRYKPHPVLVTGGPVNISSEARKFAFSPQSSELISAWALVAEDNLLKTTFYKLLFFTQNRKHKMRFFKTEEKALAWLTEFTSTQSMLKTANL